MQRLDKYLQERFDSRSKAADAIKNGQVQVNGKTVTKAGFMIDEAADTIVLQQDEEPYASRGAYKLLQALEAFHVQPAGRICLDIGASTGGFTDVLLRQGAKKVYALDVGHDQLLPRLKADPKVVNMEGCNARELEASWFADPIELIVMDASFISAKTILRQAFSQLAADEAIILVKPQFEAGPAALNKNGVLKNEKVRRQVMEDLKAFGREYFQEAQIIDTQLKGRSGNQEALLHLKHKKGVKE